MKKIIKQNSSYGITLIALVVTIVILLILAGVTISVLTGQNGLFIRAKQAKERTEYISAKERIEIELMNIRTQCIGDGIDYNIVEIAKKIKDVSDITIEKYYNSDISLVKVGVTENILNLNGIIVSVNEYSKYKFLLGKDGNIIGVLKETINDETKQEQFKKLEDFEKDNFEQKIDNPDDNKDEENNDTDKVISYVLNSKILEDENNRYTQLTDITGNNNNANVNSIDSNDEKNGIIFDGESNFAKVDLKQELVFPITVEMMIQTSIDSSQTEVFYIEPNLGISFGSWGGNYFICTANNARQVIPIPSDFYDGGLKHIAVTYNSINEFEVYINGEKQGQSTSEDYFNSDGDGTFYIGKRARGNFFKGIMYNFRIYNRVLSENEVKLNYDKDKKFLENGEVIQRKENTVLEYIIKNNESNVYTKFKTNKIVDLSNNNNNATAHNIAYYDKKDGGILDGNSSYVTVNKKDELTFPMTVEMVIQTSVDSSKTEILYFEPKSGICFGIWRGENFFCTAENQAQLIPIPSDFYDGGLKHIVVTYNSTDDYEVYINGKKQEKSTLTDTFTSDGDKTFYLGRRSRGNFFKGVFYEFNIYSNILDENRILNNYHKCMKYKEN